MSGYNQPKDKDSAYYAYYRQRTPGCRTRIFSKIGFYRARSKGTVIHQEMCEAACDYTKHEDADQYGTKKRTVFTEGFGHHTFVTVAMIQRDSELAKEGKAARGRRLFFFRGRLAARADVPPRPPVSRTRAASWTRRTS